MVLAKTIDGREVTASDNRRGLFYMLWPREYIDGRRDPSSIMIESDRERPSNIVRDLMTLDHDTKIGITVSKINGDLLRDINKPFSVRVHRSPKGISTKWLVFSDHPALMEYTLRVDQNINR